METTSLAQQSGSEACSVDAPKGSILDILPPPALAAVAAHLPAVDLLRLNLTSKATRACLGSVPNLFMTASMFALGWPGHAHVHTDGGQDRAAQLQQHCSPQPIEQTQPQPIQHQPHPHLQQGRQQHGEKCRRCESDVLRVAAVDSQEAACQTLLSAAATLAAAATPHSLRPQVRTAPSSMTALIGRSGRFVACDPGQLLPPLVLSQQQQRLLALGVPGVYVQACSSNPRTRHPCGCIVAVEHPSSPGRVVAELALSSWARAHQPHPGWAALMTATPGGGTLGSVQGGSYQGDSNPGMLLQAQQCPWDQQSGSAPAFELFLSDAVVVADGSAGAGGRPEGRGQHASVAWSTLCDLIMEAVSRNAVRAASVRRVAVLHPCATPFALMAAERALLSLDDLGYPVLDLSALLGVPGYKTITNSSSGNPGVRPSGNAAQCPGVCPFEDQRQLWAQEVRLVGAEALGSAWSGRDANRSLHVRMADMQAVSQAMARAVQALPHVATSVRVIVVPLLLPPRGRMGHAQPGRGAHNSIAAPQLLSLMAPVLGQLRAVMPWLTHLQQVLLVCPPPAAGGRGSSANLMSGVAVSLAMSCFDR